MCGSLSRVGALEQERRAASTAVNKPIIQRETIDLVGGSLTKSLRVYDDGIRIGCTFVTKAALEYIVQRWEDEKA